MDNKLIESVKCDRLEVALHYLFHEDIVALRLWTEDGEPMVFEIPLTEWEQYADPRPEGDDIMAFFASRIGKLAFWLFRRLYGRKGV